MVEEGGEVKVELDMIGKAELAAERLEKANERQAELLKKMEAIEARRVLGGQAMAGDAPPEKVESPKEYAARILRGGV